MRIVLVSAIIASALSACSSAPGANQVLLDHQPGGAFSGKAGTGWSDQELRSNAFGVLCGGGLKVMDLEIERDAKGNAAFNGKCG